MKWQLALLQAAFVLGHPSTGLSITVEVLEKETRICPIRPLTCLIIPILEKSVVKGEIGAEIVAFRFGLGYSSRSLPITAHPPEQEQEFNFRK